MSIDKILLIVLLVAVIAIAAFLILGPVINDVSGKSSLGDVAVTAASYQLNMQMTRAAATPTLGTPPPSAAELAATMAAEQFNADATRQAQQQFAQATAQSMQATQAADAAHLQQTQEAQATATGQYWLGQYWAATQTTAFVQTATAYPPTATSASWTQTAIPLIATANANQINAEQTVVSGQAMAMKMDLDKKAWTGPASTIVLWVILSACLFIVGYFVYQMSRVRKLTPDGKLQLIDRGKEGQFVVSTELMEAAVISVVHGQVSPAAMTNLRSDVLDRAQRIRAIEAAARAAGATPDQTFSIMSELMATTQRYTVTAPPRDLMNSDLLHLLDNDWEAGNGSN
ncbi:MAG: hypothetical protein WCE68_15240 [Anaerolineales bacterium]